ncbi:DNA-binding protein [bacterium]|nr:MAG: DNA-binding protein [bacterium]
MNEDVINKLPGDLREVAEIVGVDNALALVERFGGTYIRVPKCEGLLRDIRDNSIRALYDSGKHDIRALALKYRLTDRTISEILKKTNVAVPQPLLDLFATHLK